VPRLRADQLSQRDRAKAPRSTAFPRALSTRSFPGGAASPPRQAVSAGFWTT